MAAASHLLVNDTAVCAPIFNQYACGLTVTVLDGKQQRRGAVQGASINQSGCNTWTLQQHQQVAYS